VERHQCLTSLAHDTPLITFTCCQWPSAACPLATCPLPHSLQWSTAEVSSAWLTTHNTLTTSTCCHRPLPPVSLPSQLAVEYHKRFDPIYSDARNRARNLGPFSYFYSYMAQPKQQLDTFKAWAGKSSDINYYLNSHHIDVHNWMVSHMSHPTKVTALAATGGREQPWNAVGCCRALHQAALWTATAKWWPLTSRMPCHWHTCIGRYVLCAAAHSIQQQSNAMQGCMHQLPLCDWSALCCVLLPAGVADAKLDRPCEDTITLSVQWSNRHSSSTGTAIYTASWIAPKVCMYGGRVA
jgi:hypothetical protein